MGTELRKSYSELILLDSYTERLEYLKTKGENPGNKFRELMNKFYKSEAWANIRHKVILRDLCCDLGVPNLYINEYDENGNLVDEPTFLVHHINPINEDDVINMTDALTNMENLITCSIETHNKIHYSKEKYEYVERKPGDTKLW